MPLMHGAMLITLLALLLALVLLTHQPPFFRWELWVGLSLAILATIVVGLFLRYHVRQTLQAQRSLATMEALARTSMAISAKLGATDEMLRELSSSARRLLRMTRSGIALLDDRRERLRISAFAGQVPTQVRTDFDLSEMPTSRQVIETGVILMEGDVQRLPAPVNQAVLREYDARAVILIPLHVEGQCIGLMALSSSQPRLFSQADRRLARLLGSQANVILANNRLYEQTRRDAQAKSILLQELHHRVKNNLAGIVGLLRGTEPQLNAGARAWLDRVIQRIEAMASAHDLFTGGIDSVSLESLVQRVLPTLSVIKPPGVEVAVELSAPYLRLSTPKAVSLAMVLHELCSNAIVHGLGPRGRLTIASHRENGAVLIDVLDDGLADGLAGQRPPGAPDGTPESGSHMGLKLVRELVGRELGGRFELQDRPAGGKLARTIIPIDAEAA